MDTNNRIERDKNILLRKLKFQYGLCPSGVKIFENSINDVERLAKACVQWVELFIEHEESSKLIAVLSPQQLEAFESKGLFYNKKVELINPELETIILLGNTHATIKVDEHFTGRIYILNNAQLTIQANDKAKVWIDAFHGCSITSNCNDESQINLNVYSDKVKVIGNSSITKKDYVSGEIFNYKY